MRTLTDLRTSLGLTQEEVAQRVGTSKQNIYKLEKGETNLSLEWVTRLEPVFGPAILEALPDRVRDAMLAFARAGGGDTLGPSDAELAAIPVIGAVQAGAWLEAMEVPVDEFEVIQAPVEPAYARYRRFALKVIGPSMDRLYLDGTYLICIKFIDLGSGPRHGDRVIVQRRTSWGLVEATVKEIVFRADGGIELWPRSNHPAHQRPVVLEDGQVDDPECDIEIHALVIGSYRPERRL